MSNRWLASIFTVVLFISTCYGLVGLPYYATNDDTSMSAIVSGAAYAPGPDEHNLFSHVYLGLLLKNLYLAVPGVPWYGLFQIAALVLSMTVITRLILGKSKRSAIMVALAVGALTVTCVRPLLLIQFTTTAALAACAGAFLILESLERWHLRKRAILYTIGAASMLTLAALIRDDSTNLVLLVTAILSLSRFLPAPVRQRHKIIATLLAFTAAFALVFALTSANASYYQNEWKDFFQTTGASLKIREYSCDKDDSPLTQSIYRSVGWTPTDTALFKYRYDLDRTVYSLEKLTKVANLVTAHKAEIFDAEKFKASIQETLTDQALLPLVLPLVLLIPLVNRSKVPYASWILIAIGILSLCTYLLTSMKLPMRVFASLLLPLTFFVIRYISPSKLTLSLNALVPFKTADAKNLRYTTYGVLLLAAIAPSFWFMLQIHSQLPFKAKLEQDLREAIKCLSSHPDRIYVDWAGTLRIGVSPFSDLTKIYQNLKIIPVGSYGRTPFTYKRLKDAGIEDLLRQLDREDVVVISDDKYNRLIRMYAAEKLGKEVVFTSIPVKPKIFQAFRVTYIAPTDPEKLKRDLSVAFLTDELR